MPTDHGSPANRPCPHTDVASSAPVRSASAVSAASAPETTAPRPARTSGRCALASASARRCTLAGSGWSGPGAGGSASGEMSPGKGASCTSVGRLSTTVWRSRSALHHRPQRIVARRGRRVDALRHSPDRARHLGLLEVEVRLHRAHRHVAGQHQQRRAALGGLGDAGERIGEPRPRMHAAEGELLRRLGVGVGHAGGVALVPRRDQLHAVLNQGVRDLEVGGAEQAEAAARAVRCQVAGEDSGNSRRSRHLSSREPRLMQTPCRPFPTIVGGSAYGGHPPRRACTITERAIRSKAEGPMANATQHDAWQAGDSYDQYMGRWSRQVAPNFLERLDVQPGLEWLERRLRNGRDSPPPSLPGMSPRVWCL